MTINGALELLVIVVLAVSVSTIAYRLAPFKTWEPKKPKFTFFPKYVAEFEKSVSEIESAIKKIQFKKVENGKYSRGKVYGDFSAKAVKLDVDIDEENKQIKVYASFLGILFDTGDIWKVTSEIIND